MKYASKNDLPLHENAQCPDGSELPARAWSNSIGPPVDHNRAEIWITSFSYNLFPLLISVGAAAILVLFISSGLMSAGKLDHKVSLQIHRAGSIIALIIVALLFYQLWG